MTTTATQFLNMARSQVGFVEGARNDNPYGEWYGWNNVPYCAIALTWVAWKTNALDIMNGRWAYCPYWAADWRARGQWSRDVGRRGDIVFFDWTGKRRYGKESHVAVVESIISSSYVRTIEFNTSSGASGSQSDGGGCFMRTRHISTIVGFGRPAYAPETAVRPIGYKAHVILAVDGVWGPATTRRLQEVLGVTVDGEIGPETLNALAIWLGQTARGAFTLQMRTALQHRVGVQADGVIGPITVRAFQRYLNRL